MANVKTLGDLKPKAPSKPRKTGVWGVDSIRSDEDEDEDTAKADYAAKTKAPAAKPVAAKPCVATKTATQTVAKVVTQTVALAAPCPAVSKKLEAPEAVLDYTPPGPGEDLPLKARALALAALPLARKAELSMVVENRSSDTDIGWRPRRAEAAALSALGLFVCPHVFSESDCAAFRRSGLNDRVFTFTLDWADCGWGLAEGLAFLRHGEARPLPDATCWPPTAVEALLDSGVDLCALRRPKYEAPIVLIPWPPPKAAAAKAAVSPKAAAAKAAAPLKVAKAAAPPKVAKATAAKAAASAPKAAMPAPAEAKVLAGTAQPTPDLPPPLEPAGGLPPKLTPALAPAPRPVPAPAPAPTAKATLRTRVGAAWIRWRKEGMDDATGVLRPKPGWRPTAEEAAALAEVGAFVSLATGKICVVPDCGRDESQIIQWFHFNGALPEASIDLVAAVAEAVAIDAATPAAIAAALSAPGSPGATEEVDDAAEEGITDLRDLFDLFNDQRIRIAGTAREPLFVAPDVAAAIGDENLTRSIGALIPANCRRMRIPNSLGRLRPTWVLTEEGLYEYLLGSSKGKAAAFKAWVVDQLVRLRQDGFLELERKVASHATEKKIWRGGINAMQTRLDVEVAARRRLEENNEIAAEKMPPYRKRAGDSCEIYVDYCIARYNREHPHAGLTKGQRAFLASALWPYFADGTFEDGAEAAEAAIEGMINPEEVDDTAE